MTIIFDNGQLLPAAWRAAAASAAVRIFNPGLLRDGTGWLLAYRVVTEPGLERRIAMCRLDAAFRVVSGSAVPVSDLLRFANPAALPSQATRWFADPRLYRFAGRLFLYWNSGWHEPQNCQFLQELDPNSLAPVGFARELKFDGRRKLEKNWGLFSVDPNGAGIAEPRAAVTARGPKNAAAGEQEGGFYAVYSVSPYRILRCSLTPAGPIDFTEAFAPISNPGGFAQVHGGLRGGAPPARLGEHFYSFCHSIENSANGYEYVPSVYRFAGRPPFAPTDMPTGPLPITVPPSGRRTLAKLNPAIGEILYPAGAAYADGRWIISLGVDDEHCAVAVLDHADVLATLSPVPVAAT